MQRRQRGQQIISSHIMGEGEPILLVHGLSGSWRWWRRNVPALAQHYRLYLIDVPGFGKMRAKRRHFDLDEVASSLVVWMDTVGMNQVHLIGHSMGGYICLWIAAHYPERLKDLVLIAPAGLPYHQSLSGYLLPLLITIRTLKPQFFPLLIADALRAGPRVIVQAARDLFTKDIRADVQAISSPTLLIWGAEDSLVPPVLGEVLRQHIPHAQLLVLKKAGHIAMFDQPEQFNNAVLAFLASDVVGA
jgi:pimeloyl-ACP methyl ester carboxylesterase